MSRSKDPARNSTSSKKSQQPQSYVLKPSLHPHGWKLEVREGPEHFLFEVIRRPTIPPSYRISSQNSHIVTPLKIKSTIIGKVTRYSLFKDNKEYLSIRSTANSSHVLLRNRQRKIIARFSPLSPEIVLLRTPIDSVARLRFKEKPAPLHFQVDCETKSEPQWLYAVILYVIARIETPEPTPIPEEEIIKDVEELPESDESVAP